ncbi:MAG: aldehyde dehydrogenase family protein [Gammaproteobacteria bacterium]
MAIFTIKKTENKKILCTQSPIDFSPLTEIECSSKQEVSNAFLNARKAQSEWKNVAIEKRIELLDKLALIISQQKERIIEVVISETGKPRQEALSMEVYSALDSIIFYSKRAKKWLADEPVKLHGPMRFLKKCKVIYKPRGVIGIITPWNGPFILSINPVIQCVLSGNAAIIKPSEVTPLSGQLVEEMFVLAGAPKHLVQVLIGDGEVGEALIANKPDKLSFTGSVNTGRKVAELCGKLLIPFSLELGGKDAMVVCDDSNIKEAAQGAVMGSCMNAGQYCCGTERIYVLHSIYDEFVEEVSKITANLIQSDKGFVDIGATFWDKQLEIIEDHVHDAVSKGAKILVGGIRNPKLSGLFYLPTVMVDVDHSMKIMQEETFGPIICIMKVKDEEEAMQLANDSKYGLNGNIWTQNLQKGEKLARSLETGACSINDMAMSYGLNEVPFGGLKESGLGFVNGKEGFRSYCHAMPIVIGKKPSSVYPYTEKSYRQLEQAIKIFFDNKFFRKLFG